MRSDAPSKTKPLVSVVLPSFNERRETLEESFGSLIGQTLSDFECLVVDESTDAGCAAACRELCERDARFRYVRPPSRLGLPGSLNLGISLARGTYIARFDADDICVPTRLEQQVDFLAANQEVGVLGGALNIIDGGSNLLGTRRYPITHDGIARGMQLTNTVAHPTVMMRRFVLEMHGGYDPTYRYCEDIELWLRLLNAGVRFANLSSVLVSYRDEGAERPTANWKYNLRARVSHLARPYAARRLVGIAAIAAWSLIPLKIRRALHGAVAPFRGIAYPPAKQQGPPNA